MAAARREERRQELLVELLSAQPRVLRYCRSRVEREQDAQDACQEAYVQVLRKIDDLLDHESPLGWLFVTARNKCREALRRRDHESPAQIYEISEDEGADQATEDLIDRAVARDLVGRLPTRLREVAKLALDGYSVREIAERLEITENAVNLRMFRIRQRFGSSTDEPAEG